MTRDLFQPGHIGPLAVKNRIVMAPMTRSRANADGVIKSIVADYYGQRSGAGLIISEGTNISAQAQGFPNTPGIFTEDHVAAWRGVTDRVHGDGAAFVMQLWHVGRIAHPDSMANGLHPVAPSALAFDRDVMTPTGLQPAPTPHALTPEQIAGTVAGYAAAAERAIRAGCDGVEIHAANGYLPCQFLHETSNLRTDGYGGSDTNRIRFLVEVAEACAAAIGAGKVGIRVTPFGGFNGCTSRDEAALYHRLTEALAPLGLGYLHAVRATIAGNRTKDSTEGQNLPDVEAFMRACWDGPLIMGGDYDAASARAAVAKRGIDAVAFGRDFIANPDLVRRLAEGLPLAPRDPDSWYGNSSQGYTDFPAYEGAKA